MQNKSDVFERKNGKGYSVGLRLYTLPTAKTFSLKFSEQEQLGREKNLTNPLKRPVNEALCYNVFDLTAFDFRIKIKSKTKMQNGVIHLF